jgi:hypothetical protein
MIQVLRWRLCFLKRTDMTDLPGIPCGRGWFSACLLAVVLILPLATRADISRDAEWHQPWFARVDINFPGVDFHARYDFWRCACGDVLIRAEEAEPGKVTTGELLLVGGKMLLVRGFDQPEGNISALLDSPILMVQTLFALVREAEPRGPSAVVDDHELHAEEDSLDLRLDTGLASGGFPAPWEVVGMARPTDEGKLRYDLTFKFENRYEGVSAGEASLKFSGVMDFNEEIFPYDDSLSIEDWRLQEISPSNPVVSVQAEGLLGSLREEVQARRQD